MVRREAVPLKIWQLALKVEILAKVITAALKNIGRDRVNNSHEGFDSSLGDLIKKTVSYIRTF